MRTKFLTVENPVMPLILLLTATLSSMAWQGFDFPIDNNTFHVPIVLDYVHSAEGPADAFHRSLDRYVSGFWLLLSLVASESNLYALFVGIHIAIRFLTVFLVWRIAILFGGAAPHSVLFACFILFFGTFVGRSPLGRSEILVGYLTHSQVVVPIILGAWWFLFQRRFLAAATLLGVAFNINAFASIWASLVAGIVMVVALRKESIHDLLRTIAGASCLCLVVAAPTIFWILRSLLEVSPYQPYSFGLFLREFYGFHHFVDLQWRETVSFLLFMVLGLVLLITVGAEWPRSKRELLLSVFSTYAAIVVFGAVSPYVLDHRLLYALFPLRMDAYLVLLLGVIALAWCFGALRTSDSGERAYALIALFSLINGNMPLLLAVCMLARSGPGSDFGAYLRGGLWVAMAAAHWNFGLAPIIELQLDLDRVSCFLVQAVVIISFLLRDRDEFRHAPMLVAASFIGNLPVIGGAVSLIIVLGIYGTLFLYLFQGRFHRTLVVCAFSLCAAVLIREMPVYWLLVAALVFLLPMLSIVPLAPVERLLAPPSFADHRILYLLLACFLISGPLQMAARGGLSYSPATTHAYADVQLWARRNTPPHTLFLPVGMNGFAILSRRPVLADWHMGGMVMWAPEAYAHWSRRWKQLNQIRSVSHARKLAKKEGVEYIVYDKEMFTPDAAPEKCITYQNARFWIMKTC